MLVHLKATVDILCRIVEVRNCRLLINNGGVTLSQDNTVSVSKSSVSYDCKVLQVSAII